MRLPFLRAFAVSLALAAMVLRALLPDGWMPGTNAAGFVICSVDGTHSGGKAPVAPQRSHAPCAFAAAAPLAPPAFAGVVFALSRAATRLGPSRLRERATSILAYRPNAARAPPAFS